MTQQDVTNLTLFIGLCLLLASVATTAQMQRSGYRPQWWHRATTAIAKRRQGRAGTVIITITSQHRAAHAARMQQSREAVAQMGRKTTGVRTVAQPYPIYPCYVCDRNTGGWEFCPWCGAKQESDRPRLAVIDGYNVMEGGTGA